ncbi:MAG TPA: YaiI/YqxD family protein [Virgibacillus sp.]|nr:YaiI/YqxD family protein [Virgibacillus sp.]
MKIYVDADACPVTEQIKVISEQENIPVILVKSFDHFSHGEDPIHVETIYVDKGPDMADFRIVKLAKKDDIVITQDYGLAALLIGKGCIVLHHKGYAYTANNINQLLESRYTSAMARKRGERTKGPKPFTTEDKAKFSRLLKQQISQIKK